MVQKIVRLILTNEEYEMAIDQAHEHHFAHITDYLRYKLFGERKNADEYENLLEQFERHFMNQGVDRFLVRDLFNPVDWRKIPIEIRKCLGRIIQRKVLKGDWLPIVPDGKDSSGAQWYRRV